MHHLRPSSIFAVSVFAIGACGTPKAPAPADMLAPPQTPNSAETPTASPLEGAALVLDVRTPEEHEAGHLNGDVLIPVTELEARLAEVTTAVAGDKTKKVVVYCRSGGRAGRAKALLDANGFTNVVNGGGYDALK
jgi:phage shock protein E